MAKKKQPSGKLWTDINDNDFIDENNIIDTDLGPYNKDNMQIYAVNVNVSRQIPKGSDSLKPINRRILIAMYESKAIPNSKKKCMPILGATMVYHAHGDGSIYSTLVGMAQSWKMAIPLIKGEGNFANAIDNKHASSRYTEAEISKYGYECFFSDYDPDCVETIFNSTCDADEVLTLPSKFPNLIINGGMGIAIGNSYRIPPYNIEDIVKCTHALLKNRDYTDVFMYPDLPTGCDIVDNGTSMRDIINYGNGNLRMRANIEIVTDNKYHYLNIRSVPWMVSIPTVLSNIAELTKAGKLPIKDIQDSSEPIATPDGETTTDMNISLLIDKALDPKAIIEKLYTLTDLDKTVSVNFKVVTDDLTVKQMNMKELILTWIDERRSYKRRLFLKDLSKTNSRITYLETINSVLSGSNLNEIIEIIRHSSENKEEEALMKKAGLNSFQAKSVADLGLRKLNKDTLVKNNEALEKLYKDQIMLNDLVRSDKAIDDIIRLELNDLLKYKRPRRSKIISLSTEKYIADTNHNIIITNGGYIKKMPFVAHDKVTYGAFKPNDFPIAKLVLNNLDSIMLFDSFGRYSSIAINEIDNNDTSQHGSKLFQVAKLSGGIVTALSPIEGATLDLITETRGVPYLVTITKRGYVKKTKYSDFQKIKNTRNIRCMNVRDDDSLAFAKIMFENDNLVIYSKNGEFVFINMNTISEQGKDSMGTTSMKLVDGDYIMGIEALSEMHEYILVVTDKGLAKKCETKYLGNITRRNATNGQSYICTLEDSDSIVSVRGIPKECLVYVATRQGVSILDSEEIPALTKKAKGKKLISLPVGVKIVDIAIKSK